MRALFYWKNNLFYTYILQSQSSGKYYIGSTQNIEERLNQHNSTDNQKCKTTSRFSGPWQLVYSENFMTRSDAMKREKMIKSWKSRKSIEALINSRK